MEPVIINAKVNHKNRDLKNQVLTLMEFLEILKNTDWYGFFLDSIEMEINSDLDQESKKYFDKELDFLLNCIFKNNFNGRNDEDFKNYVKVGLFIMDESLEEDHSSFYLDYPYFLYKIILEIFKSDNELYEYYKANDDMFSRNKDILYLIGLRLDVLVKDVVNDYEFESFFSECKVLFQRHKEALGKLMEYSNSKEDLDIENDDELIFYRRLFQNYSELIKRKKDLENAFEIINRKQSSLTLMTDEKSFEILLAKKNELDQKPNDAVNNKINEGSEERVSFNSFDSNSSRKRSLDKTSLLSNNSDISEDYLQELDFFIVEFLEEVFFENFVPKCPPLNVNDPTSHTQKLKKLIICVPYICKNKVKKVFDVIDKYRCLSRYNKNLSTDNKMAVAFLICFLTETHADICLAALGF